MNDELLNFAVRIIRLCGVLPKTQVGEHLSTQLLRCGTMPAAARQPATVLRDLQEVQIWLKIIRKSDMLPAHVLDDIMAESERLCQQLNP